jgi:hypothetical protein
MGRVSRDHSRSCADALGEKPISPEAFSRLSGRAEFLLKMHHLIDRRFGWLIIPGDTRHYHCRHRSARLLNNW